MLPTDCPNISDDRSGANSVAPPVAPTRNSLTMVGVSADLSENCMVYRSESCLPRTGNPGKIGW